MGKKGRIERFSVEVKDEKRGNPTWEDLDPSLPSNPSRTQAEPRLSRMGGVRLSVILTVDLDGLGSKGYREEGS